MAASSAARIIRAPGRLVVTPTTAFASGTYPYGGTEIGMARMCQLTPLGTPYRVEAEGLGEVNDILEPNIRWVFTCFLRGWDDDAVLKFLAPGHSAGSDSQHAVYSVPGSLVPGKSALSRGLKIAYIPDDPVHVPGLLLYRAVPDWIDGAEIAFQRGSELGIPLVFECVRDASNRTLAMGRITDLPL